MRFGGRDDMRGLTVDNLACRSCKRALFTDVDIVEYGFAAIVAWVVDRAEMVSLTFVLRLPLMEVAVCICMM